MIKGIKELLFCTMFVICHNIFSQEIPTTSIITNENLSNYLKVEIKDKFDNKGSITQLKLAQYLREKFSERYFYDWRNFEKRFQLYKETYPKVQNDHTERALDHMAKYSGNTQWELPFNYLFGEPVNAYALRHLARQHKMVDIAFYYNYQDKNADYLNYFTNQLKSLNRALEKGTYEKIEDGNGVYESFRSGYRILNWLQIHNMFLNQDSYSDQDQLTTIATLLQHGAHLYEHNSEFHAGNHQTRGLSALAMLSILLRDFEGTDKWYERSMRLLEEHLSKEINDDGFQFERTVHYHMSDIDNYYYVYQLAKNSNLQVNDFWESKLKSLFTTLIKIAYPDKMAPVLSDDTSPPWAEKNDISGALTLGYLLFKDSEMGYFSNDYVESKMFWYVSDLQLKMLNNIKSKRPEFKSVAFPTTGYYIMREGWDNDDNMMIISNGLDAFKPDHQHGDMLGVQAIANGHVILPNYQVRYSLKDLEFFKNSMVKNVALVDNELQGKQYTSNQGGSGFGKFKELPQPKTIAWNSNKELDFYVGSHNGFENIGVNYSRQVIYLKDDFWIVKDNFKSDKPHTYKQIWQGHYSLEEAPNLLRSTFSNGSGSDIFQLVASDSAYTSGTRGKEWAVVSKNGKADYNFITVIFPFKKYDNRIDENEANLELKGWKLNNSNWQLEGSESVSLTKEDEFLFFSVNKLILENLKLEFSKDADVFIKLEGNLLSIQSLDDKELQISIKGIKEEKKLLLNPGSSMTFTIDK